MNVKFVRATPKKIARIDECDFEELSRMLKAGKFQKVSFQTGENDSVLLLSEGGGTPNRAVLDERSREHVVYGDMIIVGNHKGEIISMTDKQAERYQRRFYLPEKFYDLDGRLAIIPYRPMKEAI